MIKWAFQFSLFVHKHKSVELLCHGITSTSFAMEALDTLWCITSPINPYSVGIDFSHQSLTSVDVVDPHTVRVNILIKVADQ